MRDVAVGALLGAVFLSAALGSDANLATEIYAQAKSARSDTNMTRWNGQTAVFSGIVWIAPAGASPPTLSVPAGEHSNLRVTCAKPLAHPPLLAIGAAVQLSGTVVGVRRSEPASGAVEMWLLALSGGGTLLSEPEVVVTLDPCKLAAMPRS